MKRRTGHGLRVTKCWALAVLISSIVAACAPKSLNTRPQSDTEACNELRYVIGQANVNFKDIKLGESDRAGLGVWDTRPIFPDTECKIWSWGKGYLHYACMWPTKDEAEAQRIYEEKTPVIQTCLGSDWLRIEEPGKTGYVSRFKKTGEETTVALRYLKDKEAYSPRWRISLIVGDRVEILDPKPFPGGG
jgi:hypothetical protein